MKVKSSMSLLNEVLRDIDLRRKETKDQHILTSMLVADSSEKKQWSYPIAFAVMTVCFASTSYFAMNYYSESSSMSSTFELPNLSQPLLTQMFESGTVLTDAVLSPAAMDVVNLPPMSLGLDEQVAQAQLNFTQPPEVQLSFKQQASQQSVQQSPASLTFSRKADNSRVGTSTIVSLDKNQITSMSMLVDMYSDGIISAKELSSLLPDFLMKFTPTEIAAAIDEINYQGKSLDELVTLLDINKQLIARLDLNRNDALTTLFGHLRLKSGEPGYWSFQQAVLHDKAGETEDAFYFYKKALGTDHINHRQRKLSSMRAEQLQAQLRINR